MQLPEMPTKARSNGTVVRTSCASADGSILTRVVSLRMGRRCGALSVPGMTKYRPGAGVGGVLWSLCCSCDPGRTSLLSGVDLLLLESLHVGVLAGFE
jgi:hypothetical protein